MSKIIILGLLLALLFLCLFLKINKKLKKESKIGSKGEYILKSYGKNNPLSSGAKRKIPLNRLKTVG